MIKSNWLNFYMSSRGKLLTDKQSYQQIFLMSLLTDVQPIKPWYLGVNVFFGIIKQNKILFYRK